MLVGGVLGVEGKVLKVFGKREREGLRDGSGGHTQDDETETVLLPRAYEDLRRVDEGYEVCGVCWLCWAPSLRSEAALCYVSEVALGTRGESGTV